MVDQEPKIIFEEGPPTRDGKPTYLPVNTQIDKAPEPRNGGKPRTLRKLMRTLSDGDLITVLGEARCLENQMRWRELDYGPEMTHEEEVAFFERLAVARERSLVARRVWEERSAKRGTK